MFDDKFETSSDKVYASVLESNLGAGTCVSTHERRRRVELSEGESETSSDEVYVLSSSNLSANGHIDTVRTDEAKPCWVYESMRQTLVRVGNVIERGVCASALKVVDKQAY